MRRHPRAVGPLAVVLALTLPGIAGAQQQPRGTDLACPPGQVPPSGFTDTAGNVHVEAIDCAAWQGVTTGTTQTTYSPATAVRRDQMATFIARTLAAAGIPLPGSPPHRFPDVPPGGPHTLAVNQLAELGVVGGHPDGTYRPDTAVRRDQMARFIALAVEEATGVGRAAGGDWFSDVAGNPHVDHINVLAAEGVVAGHPDGTYRPAEPVRRDQMASFLMRGLDLVLDDGQFFLSSIELILLTGGHELDDAGDEPVFNQGQPDGLGIAVVTVDADRGELCYGVEVHVDSPVTAAHIHRGPMDANGPPVFTLDVDADGSGGDCRTDADLSAELEEQPAAYYVNVHTETYPDGAVRGQLGTPTYTPVLSWANVFAEGAGFAQGQRGALGQAWLQLDGSTGVACSFVGIEQGEGPFTSHEVVEAAMDDTGPVVAAFPEPMPFEHPEALEDGWLSAGCLRLEPAEVAAMVDQPGDYAVVVTSDSHPDGALRGQLESLTLEVPLTAEEVTDGGQPGATGVAVLQLGLETGRLCSYVETDADGPFTSADIREAVIGEEGPSVVALAPPSPDGHVSQCQDEDADELLSLLLNAYLHYVDIHTADQPGGAVRGQLDAGFAQPEPAPERIGQDPVEAAALRLLHGR